MNAYILCATKQVDLNKHIFFDNPYYLYGYLKEAHLCTEVIYMHWLVQDRCVTDAVLLQLLDLIKYIFFHDKFKYQKLALFPIATPNISANSGTQTTFALRLISRILGRMTTSRQSTLRTPLIECRMSTTTLYTPKALTELIVRGFYSSHNRRNFSKKPITISMWHASMIAIFFSTLSWSCDNHWPLGTSLTSKMPLSTPAVTRQT